MIRQIEIFIFTLFIFNSSQLVSTGEKILRKKQVFLGNIFELTSFSKSHVKCTIDVAYPLV